MFPRVVSGVVVGMVLLGPLGPRVLAAGPAEQPPKVDMNPLDWKGDVAIWTAAVFLVLLAVLWKFAWRPIADALDRRERQVAEQIRQAEASNLEARRVLAEYREKLAASEAEVREILDRGRREAEQIGREALEQARAQTELEKQRALREIEQATAGAIQELADKSATLAVELAGKLLQASLDPKAHWRLIEQAVAEFSETAPSDN